ncbi:MAG: phosphoenolpyruvate carboxylase, partial [Rugosibacter sp.]|nr:phosphoenolpyruvate carboxylase [Rugosibacter sp.]
MNNTTTRPLDMEDKDAPLRDDIRFLGRILGDTLREQEGNDAFTTVEHIRQLATRFHRHDDFAARDQLEALLTALPNEQTTQVARAFSYFSHLANIAEDQHHLRRGRAHAIAGAAPRDGSLINAIVVAQEAGVSATALANFFAQAKVSPVLTAHPTEVQRKSILDCQWEIAR